MTAPWLDRFGGTASATCAAHCLIMALAPSLMAVVGIGHGVHARIFVTGPLADLAIGPISRNIVGARRAAERIVRIAAAC